MDDLKAIHPDYKMDAKMEILGILKKYKQMSNFSPNYQGYKGLQNIQVQSHLKICHCNQLCRHQAYMMITALPIQFMPIYLQQTNFLITTSLCTYLIFIKMLIIKK